MSHIPKRFVVALSPLMLLAAVPLVIAAPPAPKQDDAASATLVAEKSTNATEMAADAAEGAATPAARPVLTETQDVLKTTAIVKEPEAPVAANGQTSRLSRLAAQTQAAGSVGGSTPAPAAADVPSLMAPFGEISSFSLGHTLPGSKWRLYPHFGLSGIYDDNIYLSDSDKGRVSDFYFAASPGLGASYGSDDAALQVRADYTASFLAFVDHSSEDTVDQNALFRVSYALPKLTLGLNLGFQSLNGASVDVGDRVRRQIYYAGLTASYVLDEKFSFDVGLDETVADYKGLYDSNETRLQTWLNYQATGKLNVGVGLTGGLLNVQESPDQTYEQFLLRARYDATGKLAIYGNAGVQVQQSDKTIVTPVFAIGAAYSPFAKTTITLDLHERVYGSAALEGQDYRATGIMVGVNQELWVNVSAFLNVGYENTSYYAVKDDIAANREDHYTYVRVGPDWQVRPWWHLSSFYEFSNNSSSGIGNRPFTRNRVGIQANFEF